MDKQAPSFLKISNLTYESQMEVELVHHTPLSICSNAIRTCWQSFAKSDEGGEIDKGLIHRVGNQYKHSSTLEHLSYSFAIEGISRACLQELARHRHASLSVKSTRYTLKELKSEAPFGTDEDSLRRAAKYLVLTPLVSVNKAGLLSLENLRALLAEKIPSDIAKYALPESYKTALKWTINARSLQNFLSLRSDTRALWEMRLLAFRIFNALPSDHKFLFIEFLCCD